MFIAVALYFLAECVTLAAFNGPRFITGWRQTKSATVHCEGILVSTKTVGWIVDINMHAYTSRAMGCFESRSLRSALMECVSNSSTTAKTRGLNSCSQFLQLGWSKPQLLPSEW